MKRPLVVCAIALIWGIILADVSISHSWGMVYVTVTLAAMLLLYRPVKGTLSQFLLLAIPFLLAGYGLHSINKIHHDKLFVPWENQDITVEGRILDEPEFIEGKTRFTLEAGTVQSNQNTALKNARIQVTVYSDEPIQQIQYGSFVRLAGDIRLPQGRRNIGGFDTRKFLAAKEISGTMAVSERSLTVLAGRKASWLKSTGYKVRHAILKTLNQYLPQKEASLMAGMLIGYTSEMPDEMEENFRRSGLSHVLAVSGANIVFLLMPLLWFLQRIGFNRRWSSAIAFPLMLFYVFATGMEASVVRAAIMAGITLLGMLFWRKTDVFCSLAASVILILLSNSYMLFDPGFILSFSATLSLVIFHKPFFEKLPVKVPKTVRDTLAGTIAAQIGVIPIIAYSFNTFSLITIISNLLVVPLTGFLTLLGALLAFLGSFSASIGRLMGIFTRIVADIMLLLTEKIAGIPWAEISIATPGFLLIVVYYLVLIFIRFGYPRLPKNIARPLLAGILAICGCILIFSALPRQSLRIYFADVGQGDCILIRTPKGKNIIIDGGGSINDEKGSYAGERIVVPLLYDLNMAEIDLMIATHGHADHIGGLKSVIDKIPVNRLIIADAPDIEMRELTDYSQNKSVPLEKVKEGAVIFQEESLILKVLYPLQESERMPQSATAGANELSLVTLLEYGEFNALFTGDIGAETENRILQDGNLIQCDVLKTAHHGSKYSSGKSFIENVNPSLSVIMVGQNRYGHPNPDVVDRMKEQGSKVYQTLENGGVLVEVWENDSRMRVTTVLGD